MDALAARTNDSETTPLGAGVWELRMQDKDGSHKWVALNGVVHFSGDAPECVCSIRPRDGPNSQCQQPSLRFSSSISQPKLVNENVQQHSEHGSKGVSNVHSAPSKTIKPSAAPISDSSSVISE